jgi:transcriptional regulator with XRE-family HTH domain
MTDPAPPVKMGLVPTPEVAQWASVNEEGAEMPIGERIKALRSEHRWSQGDLATKIGADAGQISRYENGHIAPSADAIVRLAEALDASCDYLLVEGAPRRPFRVPEDILGERLPGLDELDQEDLRALMHVLDALVAKNRVAAALKSRVS